MSLSSRGKGFETEFQNNKLVDFKITARRNKKIALWASKLLGISPSESEKFISEIISKITHDPDDSLLVSKLLEELQSHQITMTENQIRRQMGYFYQEARLEFMNEEG